MLQVKRADIIAGLQTDILRLQGFKSANSPAVEIGLGPILEAFPNESFPSGAVHEFISGKSENAASTFGFISCMMSSIMGEYGTAIWIGSSRHIFPPALTKFGLQPDRIIFIHPQKEKQKPAVPRKLLDGSPIGI